MAIWGLTGESTHISEHVNTGILPVAYVWNNIVPVVAYIIVFFLIK